jgi:glyoxylase-like metal-dependent hydrolase (beta-lactamase superfamily II)
MEQIAEGIWRWTARHPEYPAPQPFDGPDVACFAVRNAGETVLVDPLVAEGREPELDAVVNGRVRIVVTVPYHVRSSEALAERYDATIHGNQACVSRLRSTRRFEPHAPGAELPGGILALRIGSPLRQETPYYLPDTRSLAIGDTAVTADGELRVWLSPLDTEKRRRWYEQRFRPTLEAMLVHDIQRVLVTHGRPVLRSGGAALARALDAPPWHRGAS